MLVMCPELGYSPHLSDLCGAGKFQLGNNPNLDCCAIDTCLGLRIMAGGFADCHRYLGRIWARRYPICSGERRSQLRARPRNGRGAHRTWGATHHQIGTNGVERT